jgi:hypothetical protein
MGVRAAQEGDAQHPRPLDIVHELRSAGEEAAVLVARYRSAEITSGHLQRQGVALGKKVAKELPRVRQHMASVNSDVTHR